MSYKKRAKTKLTIILMLVICVYFCVLCYRQYVKLEQINEQAEQIKQQIEQAKQINQQLQKDVEYSKTDEYIEKIAREKLGLVKPGEIIYLPKQTD